MNTVIAGLLIATETQDTEKPVEKAQYVVLRFTLIDLLVKLLRVEKNLDEFLSGAHEIREKFIIFNY